jgi:hypothetical protein
MKTEIWTFVIPVHFLGALVNDDYSSLNKDDEKQLVQFTCELVKIFGNNWHVNTRNEESGFYHYHDMSKFGTKSGDCVSIDVVVVKS